jgi:hypothetical protein
MVETPIEIILSVASFSITVYFWFVQSRRERPRLNIYQINGFKAVCRRHQQREDVKRLCVQQMDSHGVLIANNSTRQNSIVLFDCWFLLPDGKQIHGDWGFVGDDRPPWNIGPESTISMGLACFFDVPKDFEIPESFEIGIDFISASGKRFAHTFTREAPEASTIIDEYSAAA